MLVIQEYLEREHMKAEYEKLDRFYLSTNEIDNIKAYAQKHITGTIGEALDLLSIPSFAVYTDDGVKIIFTNDGKLHLHLENSFYTIFDYTVLRENGRFGFKADYISDEFLYDVSQTSTLDVYKQWLREFLTLYASIQAISLNRPEIFRTAEKQIHIPRTVKKNGRFKEVQEARMIKTIYLNDEELSKRHNNITCPCWGVAGHFRHYKSGKTVFISSYRKGKKRNNPEMYQPKNYVRCEV